MRLSPLWSSGSTILLGAWGSPGFDLVSTTFLDQPVVETPIEIPLARSAAAAFILTRSPQLMTTIYRSQLSLLVDRR